MPVAVIVFVVSWFLWLLLGAVLSAWLLIAPRWRERPRQAELVSGLLTASLGIPLVVVMLFAPLGQRMEVRSEASVPSTPALTTEVRQSYVSLWEQGVPSRLGYMLAGFVLLLLTTATGAVLDSQYRSRIALVILWASAGMLLFGTLIGIMSVGMMLLPLTALAFITAIQGTRARIQPSVG